MEFSNHAKLRFAQRVLGIQDVKKATSYITNNEYEVIYKLLSLLNESELLIKNYAPTRKETLDYYINNETLIVLEPKNNIIVTLYDITLASNSRTNSNKIKHYVKVLKTNNNSIKHINIKLDKQNVISKHLEYILEYLSDYLDGNKKETIKQDLQNSINICKDYAADTKRLRMENREIMTQLFKKLKV